MRTTLSFVVAVLLVACGPEDRLGPTPPDRVPEVTFDAPALAAAITEQGDYALVPTLDTPLGATRAGLLMWLSAPDAPFPALEVRGRDADGVLTPWQPLEVTWREGAQLVAIANLEAVVFDAELRMPAVAREDIALLTWSAVIPEEHPTLDPALAEDLGVGREALRADIAALGVTARESWGARATRCTSQDLSKYRIAVHHTVTAAMGDPAANLRGIQNYHMDGNGWCDVGYHFLVSLDGRIWEGRPVHLLGAHVANHNTGNIGVSFMGCFHTSSCSSFPPQVPPDTMVDGGAGFIAGIADLYGIAINTTSVKGHRDHSGASTACPGDHLHARLNDLRSGSVSSPEWAASYVMQTFPLASMPFDLAPNETASGYLEMRNEGSATWRPGEVFLGTTQPRDVSSPIQGPDWVSANRAATIDREVAPGATGRFNFTVRAPLTPGDYPQYFTLLREGVAWFSDAGQGGPPDNQIQIRVTTLNVPPIEEDAGPLPVTTDAGTSPPPADAGAPIAPTADGGVTTPPPGLDGGTRPMAMDGCSCRVGASPSPGSSAWLALLPALALLLRRRVRGRR